MSPSSSSVHAVGAVPLTVLYRSVPADVALPAGLPLAEILPALAQRLDALGPDGAVHGMRLVTANGVGLEDSRSLADQHVAAGSVLTLEVRDTDSEDRHDDLVEAVATAVERQEVAWRPADSTTMSVVSTCALFLVAGLLLLRQGSPGLFAPAAAGTATLVLVLAAYALRRLDRDYGWALVFTAGAMAAVAAYTALSNASGSPTGLRLAAAGAALATTVLVCTPLLGQERQLVAGPLLAAVALASTGAGLGLAHQPAHHLLAMVSAGAAVISLLAPWLALASIPIDVSLPDRTETIRPEPGAKVAPSLTARVMSARGLVLSSRIACSVIVLACVPALVSHGWAGTALAAAIAIASLLGTRAVRSRADVVAGIVGGMAILAALVTSVAFTRTDLVAPVAGMVAVAGIVVLLLNVLGPTYRPRLARVADAAEIIVLLTILPLAALACEVL
ncbi:type VII secretion integral membrane protein EccD [Actinomyces ruminicola]|uniref:Type VII secretion integral membrane protein EccD n=1 Tax=Actinomyces ruminicola TaxID=332524 RepID=A0A1H0AH98_9ACTO|nr:type VII secretion integral membrane protein EccD [Actinomyces ruminicola]SDN32423.1 type VII secretion integral membrane protein EccD [Actinomyces ruminicola]